MLCWLLSCNCSWHHWLSSLVLGVMWTSCVQQWLKLPWQAADARPAHPCCPPPKPDPVVSKLPAFKVLAFRSHSIRYRYWLTFLSIMSLVETGSASIPLVSTSTMPTNALAFSFKMVWCWLADRFLWWQFIGWLIVVSWCSTKIRCRSLRLGRLPFLAFASLCRWLVDWPALLVVSYQLAWLVYTTFCLIHWPVFVGVLVFPRQLLSEAIWPLAILYGVAHGGWWCCRWLLSLALDSMDKQCNATWRPQWYPSKQVRRHCRQASDVDWVELRRYHWHKDWCLGQFIYDLTWIILPAILLSYGAFISLGVVLFGLVPLVQLLSFTSGWQEVEVIWAAGLGISLSASLAS